MIYRDRERNAIVLKLLTDDSLSRDEFIASYNSLYLDLDLFKEYSDGQFRQVFRDSIKKNEQARQAQLENTAIESFTKDISLEKSLVDSSSSSSPYSSGASDSAMLSSRR